MLRRQIATLTTVSFAAVGLAVALSVAGPTTTQAGGGCHQPDGTGYTEGPATVVRMDVCSFSPTVARVPIGTTVRFLNTAPVEHLVTGRGQSWASETLAPGAEYSEAFTTAGIYPFSCPLHPGMVGAVVVGDGGLAVAPVSVEAGSAPASANVATADAAESAPIVPAALGAAGGGMIGLVVGLMVSRRRPSVTGTDAARATSSLDA
jgi:plastocyanin